MPNVSATSPASSIAPSTSSASPSPSGLGAVATAVSVVESLQAQTGAKFAEVMGPKGAADGMTAANLLALQALGAQLDTAALSLASATAVYRDSEKGVANKF